MKINWINRLFLKLALLPMTFYQSMGVNSRHLRAILETKLAMDDRRPNTLQTSRIPQQGKAEVSYATLASMLMSLLMGVFYLVVFVAGADTITQATLFYSVFVLFLSMMLVSDFTSVLIDVRDTQIILPKPIGDRTFVVAKLLHIFIHLSRMVIPMCLPTFIYLVWFQPLGTGFFFVVVTCFAVLFSIFLINAVYLLILRVISPEKFKSVISLIQIALAVFIYGGMQLWPRMMDVEESVGFVIPTASWLLALPSYWFACAYQLLTAGRLEAGFQWIAAALAFVGPAVSLFLVLKYLAPAFNQKLAMLGGASEGPVAVSAQPARTPFSRHWSRWFTFNPQQQAGFIFCWKMMLRSRDFKLRVYPSIGYFAVIIGTAVFGKDHNAVTSTGFQFREVALVYLSSFILNTAMMHLAFSDKYKAVWMLWVTPLRHPGDWISGAVHAVVVQFYAVLFFVLSVASLWFNGPAILPNLLLAFCNQLIISFALALQSSNHFPFSIPLGNSQKGTSSLVAVFLMLMLSALLAGLHYLVRNNDLLIGILSALSVLAVVMLARELRKVSWNVLRYEE